METRADRVVVARRLRKQGLFYREIASQMGLSRSYVHALINDPDRSVELRRRERYQRPCVDCGKWTDGSNGLTGAPLRCAGCRAAHDAPEHGNYVRYCSKKWKCRCDLCRRAWADKMRDRHRKLKVAA